MITSCRRKRSSRSSKGSRPRPFRTTTITKLSQPSLTIIQILAASNTIIRMF